jgi:hypothetical protein
MRVGPRPSLSKPSLWCLCSAGRNGKEFGGLISARPRAGAYNGDVLNSYSPCTMLSTYCIFVEKFSEL